MSRTATGALFASTTAVLWGGQFVVGKSALRDVDSFHLTAVRYGVAAAMLVALLVAVEGWGALRTDGRGLRLFWLGSLGFAAFNLLAYTGLARTSAQTASLILALGPLGTAGALWWLRRVRPSRATLAALLVALFGVVLVISRGHPSTLVHGAVGWGVLLVLGGMLSFVFYTLGAAEFREFSALRYTTLTAVLGWVTIFAATAVATLAGLEREPSLHAVWKVTPQLAYITVLGAVVAVLAWNGAVERIGPQNVSLFVNLIPISTFGIEIARGYRPGAVELAGAVITLAALVAANLLSRRPVAVEAELEPGAATVAEAA